MESAVVADDTALAYFREIVEPTVAEFMRDPSDKRRGCLAALAVASMTEHFFHARPDIAAAGTNLATFKGHIRNHTRGGNAAVGWVADVANATKHVHSRGSRPGYNQINTMQMNQAGVMRAGWPLGGDEVLVGDLPAPPWRLSELIEETLKFWRARLGLETS